jgi:DHA1 family bicyclomycin/chloramphenicol resistance-like MFS transporter
MVQGVGSATGVVTVRAIVRDLYGGEGSARYLSRLVLIIGLAPVLAPSVGAQILSVTSWRGIFVVLAVFGAATLALTAFVIPETLPHDVRRPARLRSMASAFGELPHQRAFVGYVAAPGLASAVMVSMITGSTFALQEHHGFSAQQFGLLFGAGAILMICVAQLNAWLVTHRVAPRTSALACMAANAAAEIGLAVSGKLGAGAAPLCAALLLSLATWGLVASNTTALALADQGRTAGSAAALVGLSQFGLAGLVAPLSGLAGSSSTAIGVVTATCSIAAFAALLTLTRRAPR